MTKFKKGDKVTVNFGSNAELRSGVILEVKTGIKKVEVSYSNKTYDAWLKDKFLKKVKR